MLKEKAVKTRKMKAPLTFSVNFQPFEEKSKKEKGYKGSRNS